MARRLCMVLVLVLVATLATPFVQAAPGPPSGVVHVDCSTIVFYDATFGPEKRKGTFKNPGAAIRFLSKACRATGGTLRLSSLPSTRCEF